MIWFGRLSAISQLASRGGEGIRASGEIFSISLHYLAQGEGREGDTYIGLQHISTWGIIKSNY